MKPKTSEQILSEMRADDDGLFTRSVKVHTLEKLATLHLYVEGYASACVGRGYYVDGMAGPGLCRVLGAKQQPFFVYGSPLLALRAKPQIRKAVFLEQSPRSETALRQRCARFGARAVVHQGDVNRDLLKLVRTEVPSRAPCLCLLDPEGPELKWQTVRGLASVPNRSRKPELLILFPLDMAILRLMSVSTQMTLDNVQRIDAMFGDHGWWDIYQSRLRGEVKPSLAKRMYLDMYTGNVQRLGYRVQSKRIIAPRRWGIGRHEMYHLVFATAHPTGDKIMSDVFKRPFALDFPVTGQMPLEI